MSNVIEDLVNKTSILSVDIGDVWEVNSDNGENLNNKSLVGRIFSKKHCNKKFIKNVFGKQRQIGM